MDDVISRCPGVQEPDPMPVSTRQAQPLAPAEQSARRGASPPLNDGDRLTRDEFERRHDAMPNLTKAELINRVIHVPSAVRQANHSGPHFTLIGCLFTYHARTHHVIRGGGWHQKAVEIGSADRFHDKPRQNHFYRGFRIALGQVDR
jgi:hypothetical protein